MCFSLKCCCHLPVGVCPQSGLIAYLLQKGMSLDSRNWGQSPGDMIILLHLPLYFVLYSLLHCFNNFIFQGSLYP